MVVWDGQGLLRLYNCPGSAAAIPVTRATLQQVENKAINRIVWIPTIQWLNFVLKAHKPNSQAGWEEACALYMQAWEAAQDDYEACIAAHYVARCQKDPMDILHWNQEALIRAEAVGDDRVKDFYPSLYLNMGHSYELLGNQVEEQRYYALAAQLGFIHQGE